MSFFKKLFGSDAPEKESESRACGVRILLDENLPRKLAGVFSACQSSSGANVPLAGVLIAH
jgi:hypothetical protein